MNVEVNLSTARRNQKSIKVTTTSATGYATTEAISVADAKEVVTDLRAAIRAVEGRRKP